jgi:hypothetical protein
MIALILLLLSPLIWLWGQRGERSQEPFCVFDTTLSRIACLGIRRKHKAVGLCLIKP